VSITLRPEHERIVEEAVESGVYENADQVIERALELLRMDDLWNFDDKEDLSAKIERGLAQFERGESYTEEESIAEMERRKAAWLAERKG